MKQIASSVCLNIKCKGTKYWRADWSADAYTKQKTEVASKIQIFQSTQAQQCLQPSPDMIAISM